MNQDLKWDSIEKSLWSCIFNFSNNVTNGKTTETRIEIEDYFKFINKRYSQLLRIEEVAKEILEQNPHSGSKEGRPDYTCMVSADKIYALRMAVHSE